MILPAFLLVGGTLVTLAGWRFLALATDRELLAEANAAERSVWEVER